ncbi:hypothetical protein BC332_04213 [Capsicum chinense]|nr:hypothetical protein BC332_04213 [Capsicum chinense]
MPYRSEFEAVDMTMRDFHTFLKPLLSLLILGISIDTEDKTAWIQDGDTLGGGRYGMMSRKFGTAADNIIDAKLIDANRQIHDRESMEKVTVFNVTQNLEQNATQLVYKWQHFVHKVDYNLLLRLFLWSSQSLVRRGQRTVHAIFTTKFVRGVDEPLPEIQKSFPELGVVKEDCIEMSWIESIFFFAGFPRGTPLELLLINWNITTNLIPFVKRKADYIQRPISINGLEGIWKLFNQVGKNAAKLQFSPYGGELSEFSESETPFPNRDGNIFMIHYAVIWGKMKDSEKYISCVDT